MFTALSYLCVLATFMYRLYAVFLGTSYAYSPKMYIILTIAMAIGAVFHVFASLMQLQSTKYTTITNIIENIAMAIMIGVSIIVTFLFSHSLFKVEYILYIFLPN